MRHSDHGLIAELASFQLRELRRGPEEGGQPAFSMYSAIRLGGLEVQTDGAALVAFLVLAGNATPAIRRNSSFLP